jgi:lysozyme
MRVSLAGIRFITAREGLKLVGYRDSKGIPTIGVGHVILPGEPYKVGKLITRAESDRLLAQDLHITEDCINTYVKVPLTQNEFDALASFIFNIGVAGFKRSSVLTQLARKNYRQAADAMLMWKKPPEIAGRRELERALFLQPDRVTAAVKPVPATPSSNDGADSNQTRTAEPAPSPTKVPLKEQIDNYTKEFFGYTDQVSDAESHVKKSTWVKALVGKITAGVLFVGSAAYEYWYITLLAIAILILVIWYFNYAVRKAYGTGQEVAG